MNTDRLAKMYHGLTVQERLPLLLAAEKRGDKVEHQRLAQSAPPSLWQMPDYQHRLQGLNILALSYVTEQLEHLANYWHASWRLTDSEDEKPADWLMTRDVSAYVFCRQAEAWGQFCAEENVDANQLIAGNYSGWILDYCAAGIADHAPSRETLIATLKASGRVDPQPVTTESFIEKWRQQFRLVKAGERAK
jgi:hypothetical protein